MVTDARATLEQIRWTAFETRCCYHGIQAHLLHSDLSKPFVCE